MRISIAHLRAAGVTDAQILRALAEEDAERREKVRIIKRNQRARPLDGVDNGGHGGQVKSATKREPFKYPAGFEAWWPHYPLHVGKLAAFKVWRAAIKSGQVTEEELIAGADRYTADPNRKSDYTKHATTWINAGCWSDGPLPGNIQPILSEEALEAKRNAIRAEIHREAEARRANGGQHGDEKVRSEVWRNT